MIGSRASTFRAAVLMRQDGSPVQDWTVQPFLLLGVLNDALSQELLEVRQVVQESIVGAQLVRQQMIDHVHRNE